MVADGRMGEGEAVFNHDDLRPHKGLRVGGGVTAQGKSLKEVLRRPNASTPEATWFVQRMLLLPQTAGEEGQ